MQRRLISYDVFERIQNESLTTAENELNEAEYILSQALLEDGITLRCFGPETVLYETVDGNFIHATYALKDGHILFENIENLVIDEETEHRASRDIISNMVDALLENEDDKAVNLFQEYIEMPSIKRGFSMNESVLMEKKAQRTVCRDGSCKAVKWEDSNFKSSESSSDTKSRLIGKKKADKKRGKGKKDAMARNRDRINKTKGIETKGLANKGSKLKEMAAVVENVFDFINYKNYGSSLSESAVKHDSRGNVVAVKVPNMRLRNEAKLEMLKWDKMLSSDQISRRFNAQSTLADSQFARAVAELKRHNALSDSEALEETLENIVTRWPNLMYLTQDELANGISESLKVIGATNYDDQTCQFMAEGVLRMSHKAYSDRANRVLKLAGVPVSEDVEDAYEVFKKTCDNFYPMLDEKVQLEMQVFSDLYEALRFVHGVAENDRNHHLVSETSEVLDQLVPILNRENAPDFKVANEAANLLWQIIETNLGSKDWNVDNGTHVTVSGDHPRMSANAKQGYAPSSDFSGDWGDTAPVSDGNSYRGGLADEMRNRSWGNESGGGETYPSLENPYVPSEFGDYKIKGEKHVDADSNKLAHWSGNDTWPAMQNPYVPKSETPGSYKMNHGKEQDLVVDK